MEQIEFTEQEIDENIEKLDMKSAMNEISNAVYQASKIIEQLEGAGKVLGNGHHARQNIAKFAADEIMKRWNHKKK